MTAKKLHLESLRGVAALTVVFYHYSQGYMNRTALQNGWTDSANLMVDFFFVLSGYVIALNYASKITSFEDLLKFQRKRFLRLYPLHVIVLFLLLAFQFVKFVASSYGLGDQATIFEPLKTFPEFVSNLFLTQNFTGPPSWNRPSWSISAEFYTYAIFAVWAVIFHYFKKIGMLILCLIVITSAIQIAQTSMHFATGGYFRCFMSFFIGVSLVGVERTFKIISSEILAAIVLSILIMYISWAKNYPNYMLMAAPILYSVLILLLNALPSKSITIRAMSCPPLVFLGTISYGVYMIHELVESVALSFLNYVFRLPFVIDDSGIMVLDLSRSAVTLIECVLVGFVIALAYLSYRYIELPAMSIGRGGRK